MAAALACPDKFRGTLSAPHAAEAMARGLPVVASRIGALPELVDPAGLVPPNDPGALCAAARERFADERAGEDGLRRVRALAAPEAVAPRLAAAYG